MDIVLACQNAWRNAGQLTGAKVRGIRMDDAGIAYDIDDLHNYRYINGHGT